MDSLDRGKDPQCRELEQLAAAAASLDYTETTTVQHLNDPHNNACDTSIITSSQNDPSHTVSDLNSTAVPHMISYVDPYELTRSHHQYVPIRTYDSQQFSQDQNVTPMQLPASRVFMVPVASHIQSSTNLIPQNARPITHYAVTGMQFQNEQIAVLTDGEIQSMPREQYIVQQHQNNSSVHYTFSVNSAESYKTEDSHITERAPSTPLPLIQEIPTPSMECPEEPLEHVPSKNIILSSKRKTQKPIALREADCASQDNKFTKSNPCTQCKEQCSSEAEWSQINCEHNLPKRNGLSLELKIEIIKRINAGEKKSDMVVEYGVNQSTIKSIMKKSDKYLTCWKKGMFNPDSKRLKHAKREDVEQALTLWYKQSIENDTPISGSILCVKAVDFAEKLGHHDFKATHGWLDRFKKRKKIVFGRGSSKRRREERAASDAKTQELQSTILPKAINDYEPNNIFAVEHIGLFYRSLPNDVASLRGKKCPGGIRSKDRLSIVLCTNMTGNEKFPLLVVGRCQKLLTVRSAKTLPVHYVVNENSWLTTEIISSWLLDMDSWFLQQNRKVVVLIPSLTIYTRQLTLRSINLLVMPQGSPAPLRPLVIPAFKKFYRKRYLEEFMATSVKEGLNVPTCLPLFICLQLLSSSWQALSESLIVNGFQRTGLAKYGIWNIAVPTENPVLIGAQELVMNVLHILDNVDATVSFEDYVFFDNELQVCNLMSDDDILAKVTADKGDPGESDVEVDICVDNESSTIKPPFSQVESAFSVLRKYIQYQDGAQEMFRELAHLEHIVYKALSEGTTNSIPILH